MKNLVRLFPQLVVEEEGLTSYISNKFKIRLSIQSDINAHTSLNFIFVKTFLFRGVIYKNVGSLLGGCHILSN